ncbi:hypothetical protein [Bacillus thermotolerans]|uniref:hypothetical protein n=1 Tax=Bacillus thermotolerans TaxID=1221996 RepID=UPI00058944BC|nr:hypothetical protein [Bacillus thermotolerans]
MLLHTRLINIFAPNENVVRIERKEIDCRMPPINSPRITVLYEGPVDVNQCVSVVEHEFERLESIGFEPFINVHVNNTVNPINQPTEGIVKSERYEINIHF